jgi:hypothetical protein
MPLTGHSFTGLWASSDIETYSIPACNSFSCAMVSYKFLNKPQKIIDASERPIDCGYLIENWLLSVNLNWGQNRPEFQKFQDFLPYFRSILR